MPLGMVPVLFAAAHIEARSLYVPVFLRADPYPGPGRRNSQFADALQLFLIFQGLVIVEIGKAGSLFDAANARFLVVYIPEVGRFCRLAVILFYFQEFLVR